MLSRKTATGVRTVVTAGVSAASGAAALVGATVTGRWYTFVFAVVAAAVGLSAGALFSRLDLMRATFEERYLQRVVLHCRASGTLSPSGFKPGVAMPFWHQSFVDIRLSERGRSKQRPLAHWLGGSKPSVLNIVGGPGSGKSTLLRHLALKAAEGELRSSRDLPVLLSLPDHAPDAVGSESSLAEAINASLGELQGRGREEWFGQQLDAGRCLVLLDGLDEVPDPLRSAVMTWIARQVDRYPDNDFVIASRIRPRGSWPSPPVRTLDLQPLTDTQIADYMRRQLSSGLVRTTAVPGSRDETLRELRNRPSLMELARTPLLLALATNTARVTGRLPVNRTALFGELVEHLLARRPRSSSELSPAQRLRIIRVLALAMTEDGRDQAPEDWCAKTIEEALRRSGSGSPGQFLGLMVDEGVLVPMAGGHYAFAHQAFQEYLAASQIGAQGSVRLLVDHVEDARWRDIILTWASWVDASPVIEACLRRGTEATLALALDCATATPQIDPELRSELARLRRRRRRTAAPTKDALAAYVEKRYATAAEELIRRSHDRSHPVDPAEIEVLLARPASRPPHEWTEADASAFLSAATVAGEAAWHAEANTHRFKGLIALAYALRGQSRMASRDLALAALRQLDEKEPQQTDVLLGCLAYLGGTARDGDPDAFARVVRDACREAGPKCCELMVPLVAVHQDAARLVVDAVRSDAKLIGKVAELLGSDAAGAVTVAAWEPAVDKWHRTRRERIHRLCDLALLEADKESLLQAEERVAEALREDWAGPLGLELLSQALDRLGHYLQDERFEERDTALRAAERHAGAMRQAIHAAPTDLSVELAEPAAARIEQLVSRERQSLFRRHPPRPRLSTAVPTTRRLGRTVTVAVDISNEDPRAAPLEAARLCAAGDPAVLTPPEVRVKIPNVVRGGTGTTVLVPLTLAETAQNPTAIVVDLALHHRRRDQESEAVCRERLTVAVAETHAAITPNPYMAGDMGRPVADPDMLFGRDALIDRVLSRLQGASEPGAGIALFGQKRTGKSSIGVELMRRLREPGGLPVVDVGNLGALTPQRSQEADGGTLLGTLLWRILEGANKTTPAGVPLIPEGFDRDGLIRSPDPVGDCASLFDRYRATRPDCPPWVVFIDEFQYMDQWIREGLVHPSFMRAFKAIVERRLFHLVLVGQTRLERLVEEDPNAFGVFGLERVTCLAEPGARALVQEPILLDPDASDGRGSRYHDRAVEEILRLTGGNPFYIQKICFALVEYMNKERATWVTDADVRHVADLLLNSLRAAQFDGLEAPDAGDDRWTAEELRAALVAVARACAAGPATREGIERCHQEPLDPDLLQHLVSREVVRQIGDRYQFVVGLYEEWLRRHFVNLEGHL
ncbi:NACHT domain-containing protein [Streptomyces nigra]|uniref:NACHT domain-containing protein n=1 Tax=Streptomyces nigra TaxID=1827580 RepID=UPI0036AD9EC7